MDEVKEVEKQLLERMLELYSMKNQGKSVTNVERLFVAAVQSLVNRKEIQYDSAMEFFEENGIDGELTNPNRKKTDSETPDYFRRATPPPANYGYNGCGGGGRGYTSGC